MVWNNVEILTKQYVKCLSKYDKSRLQSVVPAIGFILIFFDWPNAKDKSVGFTGIGVVFFCKSRTCDLV